MKTVKKEEPIARSRFVDCSVCKNHTLKLKRTVQVGRCKSCNETYKVIVVYVKTGRKTKQGVTVTDSGEKREMKTAPAPDNSLSSWQLPSDTSLFGSTSSASYSGLADAIFGEKPRDESGRSGSTGGQ